MAITINGTTGITTPEVTLDNSTADGGQVVLKSSGYSNWNLDNYSGRFRGYYGSTEYFTVDASGNMGIGTSSPVALGAGYGTLTINGTTQGSIQLQASGTSNGFIYGNASDSGTGTLTSTPFKLFTNSTERARIDTSGNLLVGTTSGTGERVAVIGASGFATSSFRVSSNGNPNINFRNDTGTVAGSITTGASTTAYNTSSDYRLKENIAPMAGALTTVAQLKPVTYTWKVDGATGQGFIAHELQAVVPECVTGEKDAVDADGNPVYQGIDTSFLVATLTAAIQELKAELDATKAEVAALKGQQA